ncbi:hypothetical protein, partial [Stenotrophomonas maltophilia]
MQGQPEEPASILAVVGAGVQRVQTTQSSKAVEHGSTLQKPDSIIAVFIVSTKVDTHQQQRRTPCRQIAGNCRRRGGSGCGGVSR